MGRLVGERFSGEAASGRLAVPTTSATDKVITQQVKYLLSMEPPNLSKLPLHRLPDSIHPLRIPSASIAVEPGEHQVDSQVAKEGGHEADDRQDRRSAAVPPPRDPGMEKRRVQQPDDQRPGLLGVPRPVRSPGVVRPGRARDDPGGEKREPPDDSL